MGHGRADEGAGLAVAIAVDVIRIIVLAHDAGRERPIDDLREGVVGEVGIAAVDAVGQPFFLETAAGVIARHGL